jgi:hypothetical protein
MTTYNSYETARIANSERAIYKIGDNFTESSELLGRPLQPCNPADYCMTVERFLADGHKFVEGDVYLNIQGGIRVVNSNKDWIDVLNGKSAMDNKRFILRAVALEEKPSEKVEWDGDGLPPVGVECEYAFIGGDYSEWFECKVLYAGRQCVFIRTKDQNLIKSFGCEELSVEIKTTKFRKPETKQQREDRERLEAAYDLYCYAIDKETTFDSFCNFGPLKDIYIKIVDKTNYRKEMK